MIDQCFKKEVVSQLIKKVLQHLHMPSDNIAVVLSVEKDVEHASRTTSAGRYTKTGFWNGTIQVALQPDYSLYEVVAIVCHECAHHYLFSRYIHIEPEADNEKLTDIAAVYLGFGKI
jgi:uncharacterized protein YjaZ